MKFNEVELCAVGECEQLPSVPGSVWVSATVLGTVKGWVLAVLAMLAASGCAWLRAAAVPAPSGAALDRPYAPRRPEDVGTRNVPHLRPNSLRPGSNKELALGKECTGKSGASWQAALILGSVSPLVS